MTSLRSWAGELRRFLRVKPGGGIRVRMDGYEQMAVTLRDVSRGGFAIVAAAPFSPGDRFRFRFQLPSGEVVTLRAVAVHGRPEDTTTGPAAFVSGWRFLPENAPGDIDRLAAAADRPPAPDAS